MEDVLSIYARPYDPARPVVCFDEGGKVLEEHTQGREPVAPTVESGAVQRVDYSYEPMGSANLFMVSEPLRGWRRVAVTERKRGVDVAEQFKQITDQDYPDAELITLIVDNVKTHHLGVLYERYPPEEARRIAEKLDLHYTPIHGSWLNIAEIEFAVLRKQCLPPLRRIPDAVTLQIELDAWADARNAHTARVDWHFTTPDARIKLKRLYPVPLLIS
jgi:hypothetical protein